MLCVRRATAYSCCVVLRCAVLVQLFDFSLSDADMQAINSLDGTWKMGGLPLPVA